MTNARSNTNKSPSLAKYCPRSMHVLHFVNSSQLYVEARNSARKKLD